jgi:hypothetical protein
MTSTPLITALIAVLACSPSGAADPQLSGFPFTSEDLSYRVNMPTGQQVGYGHLRALKTGKDWKFEFNLDGGIPGFEFNDTYKAVANAYFCSSEFSKNFTHGKRKGGEVETVDSALGTATRTTINGGGKSEFPVPDCTRDALSLLYYTRRELGQGRVAPDQQILFGGLFYAQITYTGPETIQVAGKPVVTDRVVCDLKGPASNRQMEILFARDAARTPLLFRVPILQANGQSISFSMELVR